MELQQHILCRSKSIRKTSIRNVRKLVVTDLSLTEIHQRCDMRSISRRKLLAQILQHISLHS